MTRRTCVVATAGHVDHGKSTLVRALTGMEPDRWAEERRRGMTIDLGFAWMTLPGGDRIAFVDVPGHERFIQNMLAGLGPVAAVLFTVAADGGWMPQSAEHLAAVRALKVRHGLLVVTRADLADPGPALRRGAAELSAAGLDGAESVAVSAVTGTGMDALRGALDRLAARIPAADPGAPVRLWVDRSFTIRGSGTVVTGTLPAGTIASGAELALTPSMRMVRVRAIQALREPADAITGTARVALNLRGVPADVPGRGMALVDPGGWTLTRVVDVRADPCPGAARLPRELTVHIGAARTRARVREMGEGTGFARLSLAESLPLHAGDRILLRDPGALVRPPGAVVTPPGTVVTPRGALVRSRGAAPAHPAPAGTAPAYPAPAGPAPAYSAPAYSAFAHPAIVGATVLDVAPPPLRRGGAAAAAARELAGWQELPTAADLIRRHGLLRAPALAAMGVRDQPPPVAGEWIADPARWAACRREVSAAVTAAMKDPLSPGLPVGRARAVANLPDAELVTALLTGSDIVATDGYLRPAGAPPRPSLPEHVDRAIRLIRDDLARDPFRAPEADRLRELGLDVKGIAAAARAGLLLRVSDQIVLAPGADAEAARRLAGLPQPFTTAQARHALGSTRRVVIPLLEHLDRARVTERLPDDRRRLRQLPVSLERP